MANYINSDSIKVFPSAYRSEATDKTSSLTTEANLTRLAVSCSDEASFAKFDGDKVILCIGGYTFRTTFQALVGAVAQGATDIWASIRVDSADPEFPALANYDDGGMTLDEGNLFKGLYISDDEPVSGYTHKLHVLQEELGVWVIPTEGKAFIKTSSVSNVITEGSGAEAHDVEYSINDKFVTAEATIGNLSVGDADIGTIGANQIYAFHPSNGLIVNGMTTIDNGNGNVSLDTDGSISFQNSGFVITKYSDNVITQFNNEVEFNSPYINFTDEVKEFTLSGDGGASLERDPLLLKFGYRLIGAPGAQLRTRGTIFRGILGAENKANDYIVSNIEGDVNGKLYALNLVQSQTANRVLLSDSADPYIKWSSGNVGSSTKPLCISGGVLSECTQYAGGTNLKVNGTSRSGEQFDIYAPTSAGTNGYVVVSRGSGQPLDYTDALSVASVSARGQIEANTFNSTSDRRLKDNIEDYAPSKSILDLPLRQFDMKSDGSHHIGCIAQELREIAPELVHEGADGYLSIEESKLVYLLIDEVKKLKEEVKSLKGE